MLPKGGRRAAQVRKLESHGTPAGGIHKRRFQGTCMAYSNAVLWICAPLCIQRATGQSYWEVLIVQTRALTSRPCEDEMTTWVASNFLTTLYSRGMAMFLATMLAGYTMRIAKRSHKYGRNAHLTWTAQITTSGKFAIVGLVGGIVAGKCEPSNMRAHLR